MILQAVKTGDTIFVGHYLFTGSETTSVWLEVGPQETNCINDIIDDLKLKFEFYAFRLIISIVIILNYILLSNFPV